MTTSKKPVEKKTTEEEVKSLRSELDAITFKNKQAQKIAAVQKGKEKLKDSLAKNRKRRVGAAERISGLGKLGGLATFKQKYKDY
jgi:SPX domain protein involved in polyphosphate accumulation